MKFWVIVAAGLASFCISLAVLRTVGGVPTGLALFCAGASVAIGLLPAALGLIKTTLEIEKLRQENRKLQREEVESTRQLYLPTLEEIDLYGLPTLPFTDSATEKPAKLEIP